MAQADLKLVSKKRIRFVPVDLSGGAVSVRSLLLLCNAVSIDLLVEYNRRQQLV